MFLEVKLNEWILDQKTAVGNDALFSLICSCLQYHPEKRIRKEDLIKHILFSDLNEGLYQLKH